MDPRIYLGIDNCFASKRWTRPAEWMRLIHGLGMKYVEASADTECDPLYMGEAFIADWIREVREQGEKWGVVVKNLYSGHGTYATSGLSHYDPRVIERFRDGWMKRQIDAAAALGAGFGFFAHGFEELLLQDAGLYAEKLEGLYDTLAELAVYAREAGSGCVGLEQMYTPHQPPWTIQGARALLRAVTARAGAPFYITVDLGHTNGQQYFPWPRAEAVRGWIDAARRGEPPRRIWLGSDAADRLYRQAAAGTLDADRAVAGIMEDAEGHPHLFARPEDWSMEAWLRELGRYSPIVHLQQSDGKSSPHWPFSAACNAKGVVRAESVLRALGESFDRPEEPGMPSACGEVVLTFEPFIGTAGSTRDLIDDLHESVAYWRRYVPRDGLKLSEIIQKLKEGLS